VNRAKKNPDGTLIIEVDVELDIRVTIVFTRKNGPIEYYNVFCDYVMPDGRVFRVKYAGFVPEIVVSIAKDQALDACAAFDAEPDTQRDPKRGT
jgi:hypothetical protein